MQIFRSIFVCFVILNLFTLLNTIEESISDESGQVNPENIKARKEFFDLFQDENGIEHSSIKSCQYECNQKFDCWHLPNEKCGQAMITIQNCMLVLKEKQDNCKYMINEDENLQKMAYRPFQMTTGDYTENYLGCWKSCLYKGKDIYEKSVDWSKCMMSCNGAQINMIFVLFVILNLFIL